MNKRVPRPYTYQQLDHLLYVLARECSTPLVFPVELPETTCVLLTLGETALGFELFDSSRARWASYHRQRQYLSTTVDQRVAMNKLVDQRSWLYGYDVSQRLFYRYGYPVAGVLAKYLATEPDCLWHGRVLLSFDDQTRRMALERLMQERNPSVLQPA